MKAKKEGDVPQTLEQLKRDKLDNDKGKKKMDFHTHVIEMERKYKEFEKKSDKFKNSSLGQKPTFGSSGIVQSGQEGKKIDPNLDPVYWKENFLFPFALSKPPVPVERGVEDDGTLIDEESFKFPLRLLEDGDEVLKELQEPITVTVEEIVGDLSKLKRGIEQAIPHYVPNPDPLARRKVQIIDHVHGFKNTNVPSLSKDDITDAIAEIDRKEYSRLIGLMSHLVYWSVFGHINQIPLDPYYKKSLFVTVAQLKNEFESRYTGRRKF